LIHAELALLCDMVLAADTAEVQEIGTDERAKRVGRVF
jgi:hypothetical protein